MPKGNHVFNNFDNTVFNAFKTVTNALGHGRELDAMSGSGGDKTKATEVLQASYGRSYALFQQIMDHPTIKVMHNVQDDEQVMPDDPNSVAFGELAAEFSKAVSGWVFDMDDANPAEQWRQMVNTGFDKAAHDHYVKDGSSAKGTPSTADARRTLCTDIHGFIKAELTKLVMNWLILLRADLQLTKVVKYGKKPAEWKAVLESAKTVIA